MFQPVTGKIARRFLLIGIGGFICAYMTMHFSTSLVTGVALSVLCLLCVGYLSGLNEDG